MFVFLSQLLDVLVVVNPFLDKPTCATKVPSHFNGTEDSETGRNVVPLSKRTNFTRYANQVGRFTLGTRLAIHHFSILITYYSTQNL